MAFGVEQGQAVDGVAHRFQQHLYQGVHAALQNLFRGGTGDIGAHLKVTVRQLLAQRQQQVVVHKIPRRHGQRHLQHQLFAPGGPGGQCMLERLIALPDVLGKGGKQLLTEAGFVQYLPRRWAKPGCEDKFWQGAANGMDVLAFGLSAYTRLDGMITTNTSDLNTYLAHSADYEQITVSTVPVQTAE